MSRKPRPPAGLGARSCKIWRGTVKDYELRADELRLLEDACREVDLIERLKADMEGQPLLVDGSKRQQAIHPLLPELRLHRLLAARLFAAIGLPASEQDDRAAAGARSVAARALANARWGKN